MKQRPIAGAGPETSGVHVVKIGGRAQGDARLPDDLAALALSGVPLVAVHGGGDRVSELQRLSGREPKFVDGRRVTESADLDLIRMGLSGAANKDLVARCISAGIRAVGISGEDAALICARRAFGGTLGEVGTPDNIDPALITLLLENGYTPVLSPVARAADTGQPININGDDAAAALAVALAAVELVFVVDVPGVLGGDGRPIPTLTPAAAEDLLASGAATGGMIAKLQAALPALRAGVERVRIVGVEGLVRPNAGTVIASTTLAHAH
ncbi:MAG: acetylglutamate kinase [Gemmatimonadaceae bacterium]